MMLQGYLEELRKTKLLEPTEERALWERVAQGDLQAHKKLMTAYQPLVFKIAISFQLPEADTMELIQEGMVGLLEAAENYDYTRGVAFSVFASFRIKGSMVDYLKKSNSGALYLEGDLGSGLTLGETLTSAQASPTELAERQLLHEKVTQALGRLPEKEQQVITGMYLEDKTAQSVADAIDISLGHVYRLQKKGVRRIRGMLSRFIHDFNKI
ncbi:MAG: sigma-70 family RNA polymerase sigma factor [Phascolarctobacterium sp.]|jgi:RNA polymerase sporulation-specific sigma factor|nr:sigma-70 family RNA polymerase sigma factor [Phascolarctobacterium sp.]